MSGFLTLQGKLALITGGMQDAGDHLRPCPVRR